MPIRRSMRLNAGLVLLTTHAISQRGGWPIMDYSLAVPRRNSPLSHQ